MEKGTSLYVVSSLREYGNGEHYFGTDGIFRTRQEAEEYIRADVRDTLADFKDAFEEEVPQAAVDWISDDYSDCRVEFDDKYFAWRIDHFRMDKIRWKYGSMGEGN